MFVDNWYGIARILIVGPLAYIALVLMLRASGKRTLSKMNAFDFVITVALGSTLASIILTSSVALVEGVVGLGLLIGLQFAITWLSVRVNFVSQLVKSEPSLLFHQGTFLHSQLKQSRVTSSEVQAAVREKGHGSMRGIVSVVLETDGTFSVITTPNDDSQGHLPVGVGRNR